MHSIIILEFFPLCKIQSVTQFNIIHHTSHVNVSIKLKKFIL
jgi:hypothetical protein